jgi:hypothetical protein
MRCPNCDRFVPVEDWHSDEPFERPGCGTLLRPTVDESSHKGATETRPEIVGEE